GREGPSRYTRLNTTGEPTIPRRVAARCDALHRTGAQHGDGSGDASRARRALVTSIERRLPAASLHRGAIARNGALNLRAVERLTRRGSNVRGRTRLGTGGRKPIEARQALE